MFACTVHDFSGRLSKESVVRLSEFDCYLAKGPYGLTTDERTNVFGIIFRFNELFKKAWETDEKQYTLDDPFSVVFLYLVWRRTERWYENQTREYGVLDHCSLCMYLMYTLYGYCTTYTAKPFASKFIFGTGQELVRRALQIIQNTSVTKAHMTFIGNHKEIAHELSQWKTV